MEWTSKSCYITTSCSLETLKVEEVNYFTVKLHDFIASKSL